MINYYLQSSLFLCYVVLIRYCVVQSQDPKDLTYEPTSPKPHVSFTPDNGTFESNIQNLSSIEKLSNNTPASNLITQAGDFPGLTVSTMATSTNRNVSWPGYVKFCPSNVACDKLSAECIDCDFNESCIYGKNSSVICRPKDMIPCLGQQNFTRWFTCQYCYQSPSYLHSCTSSTNCKVISAPRQMYQANCTVHENILCLGKRTFYKMLPCNWTSGKRWSTALILSITIGGFGADRFYLGLWREGIGKLFSFGGLGVWTLVDVVLVATGYIEPADGSLYIW